MRLHKALHSVRLSVCHMPSIYSKQENHRNLKSDGGMTLDMCNKGCKFEVKKSKVKVTGKEHVKIAKSGSITLNANLSADLSANII